MAMAVGMAARYGAHVHACLVFQVAFSVPVPVLGEEGEEMARQVAEELSRAGVAGELTCRNGDVAQELEALAEACRADVIVVGRSRHPALHLGGVPRRLLAMGRHPVLVVP